jgi:hypothetical protein
MKWRVILELGAADGTVQVHEVSSGECTVAACSAETLGLSIADGKTTLAGLQRQLVQAQTEEHETVQNMRGLLASPPPTAGKAKVTKLRPRG